MLMRKTCIEPNYLLVQSIASERATESQRASTDPGADASPSASSRTAAFRSQLWRAMLRRRNDAK